jgi:hypothetical protein
MLRSSFSRLVGPIAWAVLFALSVGACNRDRDYPTSTAVASHFPDVEPFVALAGVRPGMTLRELTELRPSAVVVPGYGAREVIGDDTVEYQLPVERLIARRGGTPDQDWQVTVVEFSRALPTDSAADSVFRERLRAMRANPARIREPRCSRWQREIEPPSRPLIATVPFAEGVIAGVVRQAYVAGDSTGTRSRPPGVRTFVGFLTNVLLPPLSETVDCPT